MDKDHLAFLKELGFTSTESIVYLILIELGESLAGTVAGKAKLYRKNAYDALGTLSAKGYVTSHSRNKKIYWEAVSPEKIKSALKEKLNHANDILPSLLSKFNSVKSKQSVEVFQGIEGMKSFNKTILKEGKTVYGIGLAALIFERLKFSIPDYVEELTSKDIKVYFLVLSSADKEGVNRMKKTKNVNLRTLPKSFSSPTQLYVCGDYSGIWIWSEEPVAILIKNKEIAQGFKKYFDFLWAVSK